VYEPVPLKKREQGLLRSSAAYVEDFARQGLLFKDEALQVLLDRVGESIAPDPLDDYVEYRFYILRSPFPNAFALPDGQIFVTSGMLALLENEAQLAGVLAHEVTHTEGHHGVLSYRSQRKKMITGTVVSSVLEAAGAQYMGVAGLGSISNYYMVVSILGYSRDLEFEADEHGFARSVSAGYDPREMARIFLLMDRDIEGEQPELKTVWSTHPDLEVRAHRVTGWADALARQGKLDGVGKGDPDMLLLTHEIALDVVDDFIDEDYPRHAVALARDLVARAPEDPRCHSVYADGLRALGARTEEASSTLTDSMKRQAVHTRQLKTREEREEARLQTTAGRELLQHNLEQAQAGYLKAIELDPEYPAAHRGLGYTLERLGEHREAGKEFVIYLKLLPEALDRQVILNHLQSITEKLKEEGDDEN
jgi:predicted Zn-dependent protease